VKKTERRKRMACIVSDPLIVKSAEYDQFVTISGSVPVGGGMKTWLVVVVNKKDNTVIFGPKAVRADSENQASFLIAREVPKEVAVTDIEVQVKPFC
jgi:hypothetical protein